MSARHLAAVALAVAGAAHAQGDARRSGHDFMSPATQAMQRDDAANPAMLGVGDGEALWRVAAGRVGKSCADCHGDAKASMRGVAARYPAYDETAARPLTLAQRVDACRMRHQEAPAFAPESQERLALESYVALQSRGMPIAPPDDARLAPFRDRGATLWRTRVGQLDLSCAQCHDALAGERLAGSVIPQAHPTGYPIYRLEWQSLGSLERRLRGCLFGVRARVPPAGAIELVELEAWLAVRAAGMAVDAPGVRP
ncbi:MAG TPA: sulfur oxidation c-type cytochrome SoxA [Casimicrobiaceae bacterium]|jgi:sulfur-oxidizing protein SoxA